MEVCDEGALKGVHYAAEFVTIEVVGFGELGEVGVEVDQAAEEGFYVLS